MRYAPNDKYTIAWFKLAECVAKGEKEKACGVYRLLKHSLEDEAYAYQLEGDLLGAFGDERALQKYAHAAHLYYQNNRFKEAAALYEDLLVLEPTNDQYVLKLVEVYKHHKNNEFFFNKITQVIDIAIARKLYTLLLPLLVDIENRCTMSQLIGLYTHVVLQAVTHKELHMEIVTQLLHATLNFFIYRDGGSYLQSFLSTLEQTDSAWYKRACSYIKGAS